MVSQRLRDKQQTRERISGVATELFLDRGFDAVTVAEVAAAAEVSKVTVFAHFARKEDLLLDRAPEALELIGSAITERPADLGPLQALRSLAVELAEAGHPFSGLSTGNEPFLRTLVAAPSLVARARELLDDVERALSTALGEDSPPIAEPRLVAALAIAAYRTVVAETTRRVLAGDPIEEVSAAHRRRLDEAFDALDAAAGAFERFALAPDRMKHVTAIP